MISRGARPSGHRGDSQSDRQERKPYLDRVVVQHTLHVQRAEEEHAEQTGDGQRLDEIRPGDRARAEHAQRHQRVGGARLAIDEAGHQGQ
jgi:hypothetical protein